MTVANPVLPEGVSLRPPGPGDLPAVRRLLSLGALPLQGLEDAFGPAYVVAVRNDGTVLGVAGVEEHGRHGLLRSVAVSADAGPAP